MKNVRIVLACLLGIMMVGCKQHVPSQEPFPLQTIDFSYQVNGEKYTLDYYVGASIRFYTTVTVNTDVTWDFGDGNTASGTSVDHTFTSAGTYSVTAKGNGGEKTQVIYIADIRPIVTQIIDEASSPDGLVTVGSTYVSFQVELPNPSGLAADYYWTFPEGTTDENGSDVASFVQKFAAGSTTPDKQLGKVKFAKVGSQSVQLQVKMQIAGSSEDDKRNLDAVIKNVQVAFNQEAPTLYYVVKDGTIHALKIPAEAPTDVAIEPYDMGVSSGQHMLNIVYDDGLIYMLDCGKQFVYVNDIDGNLGDGKMQVMAVDASTVGTVISNVGGTAFKDPYFGFVEGDYIYYSDRNTGFRKMEKATRNAVWDATSYPSYVENNWLGYYGNSTSMIYGCFNACFARIDGVWWWCKKDYGAAMWRFEESDIVEGGASGKSPEDWPQAGHMFEGSNLTAFVYDKTHGYYYYAFYGSDQGVYRFTEAQCALGSGVSPFSPNVSDDSRTEFNAGMLKTVDGGQIKPDVSNSDAGEGNVGEYVGVCQMALEETTGDVYFGYRSTEEDIMPSGIYRYNAASGYLELVEVTKGTKIYGVCINPNFTKLF